MCTPGRMIDMLAVNGGRSFSIFSENNAMSMHARKSGYVNYAKIFEF